METIGFVGSGNMAEALINGIIKANLYQPRSIYISDIRTERLKELSKKYGVVTADSNSELAGKVDTLVLSIKPQSMVEVLEGIKETVREDALIISIAAGVKINKISNLFGKGGAIVRVMPNTPALISEGCSALYANEKGKEKIEKARLIFSSVGEVVEVESEDLMDAVTAVSGSGPAYYFLLMEEIIKAGVELGLEEEICKKLVLQTAKGASLLANKSDGIKEGPCELRKKVTSPGGTTEAAIKVLADGQFGSLISKAVKRAYERSKELSQ